MSSWATALLCGKSLVMILRGTWTRSTSKSPCSIEYEALLDDLRSQYKYASLDKDDSSYRHLFVHWVSGFPTICDDVFHDNKLDQE